ncbi:MAG: NAD-dependent epimerase/dehydratase family protein, partial [bacterium]|nr:NAD-dependent epimerase/dehydratase family protein [bacterium]
KALKIAVLGTDSAIGKRTTAWLIVKGFTNLKLNAEMIGTGQTAWMQGARFSLVLDSLINDFVSGEIEHAVWSAWRETKADALVIEGQGSLMNPAYPGGFEILAAGRPDLVVLQHAPARKEYDGFPGYPLHPLPRQIEAIELLSGKPVVAVTINHEGLSPEKIPGICDTIERETGRPAYDVLLNGTAGLVETIQAQGERGRRHG